jgi:hypothetical protein
MEGAMVKSTEPEASPEVLEQGDIYFLYRPKVCGEEEAKGEQPAAEDLGDVQNFYIVLKNAGSLPEGFKHKREPKEPVDVRQGRNSLGNIGYDGPLGTLGRPIRYCFRLFALDQPIDLPPGPDREAFLAAASGHILERDDLVVTYERAP